MGDTDTEQSGDTAQSGKTAERREYDGQEYLDRSKLDFDPDDGLYSGTAVDGESEIPGPHEADGYSESGDQVELGDNAEAGAEDATAAGSAEEPST